MNKFKQAREVFEKALEQYHKRIRPFIDLGDYYNDFLPDDNDIDNINIHDLLEALAVAERMAWREMDTAPHGEIVLLWSKEKGVELDYASFGESVFNPAINQTLSNKSYHGWATHWMPLPETKGLEDEL